MNGFWGSKSIELQRGAMQFGHADRKIRYAGIMDVLSTREDVSGSFPLLFKNPYQLKGFYRFINTPAVTHNAFMSGYQQGLIQYATGEPDNK